MGSLCGTAHAGPGIAVVAVLRAHVRTGATYFRAPEIRAGSAACGCLGWVCAVRSSRMRSAAGKNHRARRPLVPFLPPSLTLVARPSAQSGGSAPVPAALVGFVGAATVVVAIVATALFVR